MDMIDKINKIENKKSCKSCKSCQYAFQNMSGIRQNSRGDGDTLHLFQNVQTDVRAEGFRGVLDGLEKDGMVVREGETVRIGNSALTPSPAPTRYASVEGNLFQTGGRFAADNSTNLNNWFPSPATTGSGRGDRGEGKKLSEPRLMGLQD